MRVLVSLGNVECSRGDLEASQAWYERALEQAVRLDNLDGQATTRGNLAALLRMKAGGPNDPEKRLFLLTQAIREERQVLALRQRLSNFTGIALSHRNLADYLREAGLLDDAERHAQQGFEIDTRQSSPEVWQTLLTLERIAAARGDAVAEAEYRRRKEAARAEAEQRAGDAGLPLQTLVALLQLALTARAQQVPLPDALRAAGADDPAALLAQLEQHDPWLATHLTALASGAPRPPVAAPDQFADLLDEVWVATDA
jgi:tetratricopeptide (TPR) repeat protein